MQHTLVIMRLRAILLALVAVVVLPAVLSACGKKPMENKTLDNPSRDDTSKAMKAAGGGDD